MSDEQISKAASKKANLEARAAVRPLIKDGEWLKEEGTATLVLKDVQTAEAVRRELIAQTGGGHSKVKAFETKVIIPERLLDAVQETIARNPGLGG